MSTKRGFKNPEGHWSYEGPFHAHIRNLALPGITLSIEDVVIEGTIIRVGEHGLRRGRIEQGRGAIQLYAGDQAFYLGYNYLIRLCRLNGQLIWRNRDFTEVVMQEVQERPHGAWPMFYYDGKRIIGQIGDFGPWYQLDVGQQVKFDRHGTFRFTKAFKTLVYLDVTLPRKGWNPTPATYRIRIPTGKCLYVFRSNYYLERMRLGCLRKGFGYKPGDGPIREVEVDVI